MANSEPRREGVDSGRGSPVAGGTVCLPIDWRHVNQSARVKGKSRAYQAGRDIHYYEPHFHPSERRPAGISVLVDPDAVQRGLTAIGCLFCLVFVFPAGILHYFLEAAPFFRTHNFMNPGPHDLGYVQSAEWGLLASLFLLGPLSYTFIAANVIGWFRYLRAFKQRGNLNGGWLLGLILVGNLTFGLWLWSHSLLDSYIRLNLFLK
jgi:hypothetical protein